MTRRAPRVEPKETSDIGGSHPRYNLEYYIRYNISPVYVIIGLGVYVLI